MKRTMKVFLNSLISILLLCFAQDVHAGFMDKLNQAAQKLNEKTQAMQQRQTGSGPRAGEDPDKPLHLEDYDKTGSCEGKRSAVCMDYMELVDHCMDPLKGYRMKVTGDLIDKKLKTEKLTDQQRKNLEEDLVGIKEAEKNKSDYPTIAGKEKSQRYLMDISEEDQIYINAEYMRFNNKITNKCIGADHMGIGRRTEMIKDPGVSGEEAVAQFRKNKTEEKKPFDCLKQVSGVRFKIMADMMEKKMQTLKLSDQERAEWLEDIAAVRETALAETPSMPKINNPTNPYRPITRLTTPEEQMEIATESSKQSQKIIDECSKSGNKKIAERAPKSGGPVDHSQSPANPNAKKQKRNDIPNMPTGVSTNLTYMKGYVGCFAPLKGHFAKVHANALEEKYKSTQGLTEQEKQEWQEDIASWRAAQSAGVDRPTPPDPDNPYRWQDRLTKEERQKINMTHNAFNTKIMKECGDKPSGL